MTHRPRALSVLVLLALQQLAFLITWTPDAVRQKGARPKGRATRACAGVKTGVFDTSKTPQTLFDALFRGRAPNAVYSQRPERQAYLQELRKSHLAIINDVDATMAHDMVSFEPQKWADKAAELSTKRAGPKKTFLATVRGMGGGKTRALEEIRYELLGMGGVLPLAITYNSGMELLPRIEFAWSRDYDVNYAMTVVARMAAVFYGMLLEEALTLLRRHQWQGGIGYPLQLIRGFICHAVLTLRAAGVNVKTVVVLADEVAKAEEAFSDEYNLRSAVKRDVTSVLRSSVLDMPILNISATLDDPALGLVAAALADTPRFVEYAHEFLKTRPDAPCDQKVVKELFEHVRKEAATRLKVKLPSAVELYCALLGESTERDDVTMARIARGIYVNSLAQAELLQTDTDVPKITPKASLFQLSAAAKADESSSFAELVAEFPENIGLREEGRPLECCAMWWLRMRLAAAAGRADFPLEKLLGVAGADFDATDREMLTKLKRVTFHVPADNFYIRTSCPRGQGKLASRYKDGEEFLSQLGKLGNETCDIWLLEPATGEAFDILLTVFDTNLQRFFVAFIDLKAKRAFNNIKQAELMQSLVQRAKEHPTADSAGLVRALAEGRYCFLYVTTAEGQSTADEVAINLKGQDTDRFFGPLTPVHASIRKAFESK